MSGLIAGALFAIAQVVTTLAMGESATTAFRTFASVLLGPPALSDIHIAAVVSIALITNVYVSAMCGLVYGLYNSALTMATRRSVGREAIVGTLFGVIVWLVNFRVIAPIHYTWLLELAPVPQLLLHALCFGLPLGILYATGERRFTTPRSHYSHPHTTST
ncbi:MAG TPA: hypothetical protein VIV11_11110 [Kofleriaceae bacterium]